MAKIVLEDISKFFGNNQVLKNINLEISDSSITVLVGPSGCGKTTTLRIISGLESASSGKIFIGERNVSRMDPKDRNVAMVFQNYALYPHLNVRDNINFGLRAKKVKIDEINRKVANVVDFLGIKELLSRYPSQLSGGQQQRVAIGRAIVRNPDVFLFDEPLSNLDAKLRIEMRTELLRLHKHLKKTAVYVTHDQEDAMSMGDTIIVMQKGEIIQMGTPQQIYQNPSNMFVAGFVGSPSMNLVKGTLTNNLFFADYNTFSIHVNGDYGDVYLGIRPENIILKHAVQRQIVTESFKAEVEMSQMLGSKLIVNLRIKGLIIKALFDEQYFDEISIGNQVEVVFDRSKLHYFEEKNNNRINISL